MKEGEKKWSIRREKNERERSFERDKTEEGDWMSLKRTRRRIRRSSLEKKR